MTRGDISLEEARRIALAAQGFDHPRPTRCVGIPDVRRTIHRLGLLQLDFVNLLTPSHYQVIFSRLGAYEKSHLNDLVYRRREFTEQWAHEASIVPMETWALLRHRMMVHRVRPWGFEKFIEQQPEYLKWVVEEVRARGPLTADELPAPDGTNRRLAGAWFGTVPRATLEAHFGKGLLAVADRRSDFARFYDLSERVIPAEHHRRMVDREDSQRELIRIAARAYGIATGDDLADYFRMPVREARPRIAELVEAGELREARVEGWRSTAYLHPKAASPRRIDAASLLSPFDPVIWYRPRVTRLFQFDYRFEIFVPVDKRKWGTYVLPFLLGDRLVARVDLKAERSERRLLVQAAYIEPDADPAVVAGPLARELGTMARWLGLESISSGRRGNFARQLGEATRG